MAHMSTEAAPNLALWSTDYARSLAEASSLALTWPILSRAPRGDGHPVLVLPGLGASDLSTTVLRRFLRQQGYRTYRWKLGTNLGLTAKIVDGMPDRLADIRARNNGQPISIIGWSLGGIFARRLARATPESVRQVITLGSPIRLRDHAHSNAHWLYNLWRKRHVEDLNLPLEDGLGPLLVPATSVYSRLDGFVPWSACLDEPAENSENVEVRSSHLGFGQHPAVLYVVADRLAQKPGQWAPFRSPRMFRSAFPTR
ncbi:lipase family alpha/beta hydrolase [Smaragdicoccus niigatensis]|uniref:lipase family alpha/beta hydrolase n=1 Tax=Smaragdicoccus niigatensis TaxID=359359 RepID=UPI000360D8DA|nr:alpha/beta fold hydrolase [Smaragdicoccus niigatensis]